MAAQFVATLHDSGMAKSDRHDAEAATLASWQGFRASIPERGGDATLQEAVAASGFRIRPRVRMACWE
jgi:hypothetical protein